MKFIVHFIIWTDKIPKMSDSTEKFSKTPYEHAEKTRVLSRQLKSPGSVASERDQSLRSRSKVKGRLHNAFVSEV